MSIFFFCFCFIPFNLIFIYFGWRFSLSSLCLWSFCLIYCHHTVSMVFFFIWMCVHFHIYAESIDTWRQFVFYFSRFRCHNFYSHRFFSSSSSNFSCQISVELDGFLLANGVYFVQTKEKTWAKHFLNFIIISNLFLHRIFETLSFMSNSA